MASVMVLEGRTVRPYATGIAYDAAVRMANHLQAQADADVYPFAGLVFAAFEDRKEAD